MRVSEWTLRRWHCPAAPDKRNDEPEHRVAFLARQEDFECLILAKWGMEVNTISSFTGLSKGQVQYRLKLHGVSTRTFRQGKGPWAQMVFDKLKKEAAARNIQEVRIKQLHG